MKVKTTVFLKCGAGFSQLDSEACTISVMDVVPQNWNLPEKLEFSRNLPIFSSFSGPFWCVCFAPLTTPAATEQQLHSNNNCRRVYGFRSMASLRFQLLSFLELVAG